MNKGKIIKYGVLIIFGITSLCLKIRFGDYCEGMAKGLLFAFLFLVFLFIFLLLAFENVYKMIRKKEKFDFLLLSILVFFILSNSFLFLANEHHFWKKIKFEGEVENARSWIILYENNSFEATNSYVENRCTYIGKYHIENNVYILDDENIESKSNNNFTKKYLLISDSILQPLDKSYSKIKLKN